MAKPEGPLLEGSFDGDVAELLSRTEDLPSMPAAAAQVLALAENEATTISDLARAISRDPALASLLLRTANSPLFHRGPGVSTVERATMILGIKTVKLLCLGFSLVGALPRERVGDFDLKQYWKRSLVCAAAARTLADRVRPPLADEAFLVGLLARIGQLVLAWRFPERYASVLAGAAGGWPTAELEQRSLGFASAAVAREVLSRWSLPRAIAEAVGHVEDPEALPADAEPRIRELAQLCHLARLCESLVFDEEKSRVIERLSLCASERFGLDSDQTDALLASLGERVERTAEMLNVALDEPVDVDRLVREAQQQLIRETLGMAVEARAAERRSQLLESQNRQLSDLASRDPLTGLANRAHLEEVLAAHVEQVRSGASRSLGVLMVDVDHFKRLNDTYGHPIGDRVLQGVARVLQQRTRDRDLPARYGGEEFAVVAPEATPEGLGILAERIRGAIASTSFEEQGVTRAVTVSIGGACTTAFDEAQDGHTLIAVADRYLYQAKAEGRDCCRIFPRLRISTN